MKAILLIRVSTDTQSIDEQSLSLKNYALTDGYNESDIIIIEDKESAIKLTEEERNGLNILKQYINESVVETVYVWEISRIARKKKVLYSIYDLLIEKKIQLKVYSPKFELLDETTKEVTDQGSLLFSLFSTLSESEIRNKKARFHRSKIRNARTGKYSGGFIKYGYTVDDQGYYIIKEDEAEFIRLVFNLYSTGLSEVNIGRELRQRGHDIKSVSQIRNILLSDCYTGFTNVYGLDRSYPPIISKELFAKCREVAKNNNRNSDKTKNIYYCNRLINCECGSHYIAMLSIGQYLCYKKIDKEDRLKNNEKINKCQSANININLLDSIIWEFSKRCETDNKLENFDTDKANFNNKIEILNQKIVATNGNRKQLDGKRERNNTMYFNGSISDEKFKLNNDNINAKLKAIENDIVNWNNEIQLYQNQLSKITDVQKIKEEINNYSEYVDSIQDNKVRQSLVQKHIKSIKVKEVKQFHRLIIITQFNDNEIFIIVNPRTKKAKMLINLLKPENLILEESKELVNKHINVDFEYEFIERFQRRK